jgi:RNA polymerase sigma factor (sigma-70 family)
VAARSEKVTAISVEVSVPALDKQWERAMEMISLIDRSANVSGRSGQTYKATIAKDEELTALMQRVQFGNEGAYSRLIQEMFPLVRRMTRRRMARANASDLDDVVQDVMLSVHTARANYDPSRPFIPWLKAIVSNRTVDFVRKQQQAATMGLLPGDVLLIADDAAKNALAQFENVGALRKAVEQLPSRQRLAIELLKLRELSLREAAALTGESVSALKSSIHRAVGTLRTSLAPYRID